MAFNYDLEPGKGQDEVRPYEKKDPTISIITPAWNSAEYLFQTAQCIFNQTYPYFEWVIVDDGSTNKESLKILDQVEKLDDRITVLHKKNEGPSAARDYGARKCNQKTKYLVFLDDDDVMDKTFLECAYFSMETYPKAAWCYSDVVNFESQQYLWNKQFDYRVMQRENLLCDHAMIRKEDFYEVNGFEVHKQHFFEDWNLWLKFLAKEKFPIHMSYYGFWYRRKKQGSELKRSSNNKDTNQQILSETASKIKKPVFPIEFPRENYNYEMISELSSEIITPDFKKVPKKRRILLMTSWMVMGGADKFNLDFLKRINHDKYEVTLVTTVPTEYTWRQDFEQVCTEVFDLSTFLDRKDWPAFLQYLMESRKFDIVFNTNTTAGYMLLPFLKSKYPDLLILDYIHMEEWYNRNGGYSRDSMAVHSVIDRTLFCNQNSESIMHDHFGVAKELLDTLYIGVDQDKFDPQKFSKKDLLEKYHLPNDKLIISFIARIDYQKRPFLLIDIIADFVKENPNVLFVVAGDGPLLESVKEKARELGVSEYIRFLGKSDHPEEIYAISDIQLNCSIKEGLALTSYESLSMGVPVVSSDVGGQKELIDEKTGVIVPCLQAEKDVYDTVYSKEESRNYVEALLKVSRSLKEYKNHCRKRILNRFTLDQMGENMNRELDCLSSNASVKDLPTDIAKELYTEFLMADKDQYDWLCREYRLKIYGVEYLPENVYETEKRAKLKVKIHRIGEKFHVANEAFEVGKLGLEFLRAGKQFLKNLIKLPILFVKVVAKLCVVLAKAIKRTIISREGEE